jgi:hypothetical protein
MLRAGLLVFAASSLLWINQARACKCAEPASTLDALHAAAAVFEGQVTGLSSPDPDEVVVELNVVRTWKDANSEHITLRTHRESAACGYPFELNTSYLIFADEAPRDSTDTGLSVAHCSRTKPILEADDDLLVLGLGVVPVAPHKQDLPPGTEPQAARALTAQRDKPAAGGCASCSAGAGAGANTLDAVPALLVGLLARRRGERRGRAPAA